MPIKTNRIASLMVVVGVAGASASVTHWLIREPPEEPVASRPKPVTPENASDKELCKLARDLSESRQGNLQRTGESLRNAGDCPNETHR